MFTCQKDFHQFLCTFSFFILKFLKVSIKDFARGELNKDLFWGLLINLTGLEHRNK